MTKAQRKMAKIFLSILLATLLTLHLTQVTFPQNPSNTKVVVNPATTNAFLGETITINITLSNVQNLYGLDVTLLWNPSALTAQNVNLRLGVESHPDGVLHESPGSEIFIHENTTDQESGEYRLVATSVAPAPPFSGSGNIAIITFKVISIGNSELVLITELADYNPAGSNLIDHTDVNGAVNSVIPEFPSATAISLIIILVTIGVLFSKKLGKLQTTQALN